MEHPGRVYLGLGSNLGDREGNLHDAIEALRCEPGFVYLNRASIYRTSAIGPNAGDEFRNTVVAGLWSGSRNRYWICVTASKIGADAIARTGGRREHSTSTYSSGMGSR